MKTALVFGGTRFFGKNLVETLLDKGVQVTIATRQQSQDPFGDRVERIKVDRFDEASMKEAVVGRSWDVVFDQLCYTSHDAQISTRVLEGKIKKYVFTSSGAVYDFGVDLPEQAFDPYTYHLEMVEQGEVSYGEGKRLAEAYFFQKAPFPVVALRIPVVLGEEDYTERLLYYVKRIKEGKPVYFSNPEQKLRFIHQKEAGDFLAWVAETPYEGPINACAEGPITMKELMEMIGTVVGKEPIITTEDDQIPSEYDYGQSRYMSTEKASQLGYQFTILRDWLPDLIAYLNRNIHFVK